MVSTNQLGGNQVHFWSRFFPNADTANEEESDRKVLILTIFLDHTC